ncbi:MAG TPA: TIGR01777 family oxidoreductase [Bacteroidota bacterium]
MRILLAGGTGFIGRKLYGALTGDGHSVTVLSRSDSTARRILGQKAAVVEWDGKSLVGLRPSVDGLDAIVNLSGESIAGRRWSSRQKERLLSSRLEPTRAIVKAIGQSDKKPALLINQSAVGYYGNTGDAEITEDHLPGSDFLATLCQKWEAEAKDAEEYGVRVVRLRTGIVLGRDGGALERMLVPFRLFVGGPIGSGKQWTSWIHLDDVIGVIRFALTNAKVEGPVNCTAPEALTNLRFSKTLGRILRRPSWAPVPAFVLKVLFGEMAEAVLLGGQRVVPGKLMQLGYEFRFPRLQEAFEDIFR